MKKALLVILLILGILLTLAPAKIHSYTKIYSYEESAQNGTAPEIDAKCFDQYLIRQFNENSLDSFDIGIPKQILERSEKQDKIVITPEIKIVAYHLTKNDRKLLQKAYHLQNYVYNNISYEQIPGASFSYETLKNKKGDCLDKAILLSAMLEATGIENYIVETSPENYQNHAYVIAKMYGKFLVLETTSSFFTLNRYKNYEIYNKDIRFGF